MPKITDLSNCKIWIGNNPELSEKIQKRAFELGWSWMGHEGIKAETHALYFNVGNFYGKYISCNAMNNLEREKESFANNSKQEIFAEQILLSEDKSLVELMKEAKESAEVERRFKAQSGSVILDKDNIAFIVAMERKGWFTKESDEKPKAYILQKDLAGVKKGTRYLQHPKFANRYYPENCYENNELIHEKNAIYGFITEDVKDTEFFLPEEQKEAQALNHFTKEELEAIKTDVLHILKRVTLNDKNGLLRTSAIQKIEKILNT